MTYGMCSALKTVMVSHFQSNPVLRLIFSLQSYTQKRPSKSRGDKDNVGGGKPAGGGAGGSSSNGGGGNNSGSESQHVARPRGTSDARWRNMSNAETSNSGYSKPEPK